MITTTHNPDGTIGPDITALMESFSGDLRESNNDGFEVIYKVGVFRLNFYLYILLFRLTLKNYLKFYVVND
jgi:hypothetical protein